MFKALAPTVALLLAPGVLSAGVASKDVHRTVALDRDGQVSIETFKGKVTVTGWDKPEADISAHIFADDSCGNSRYQSEMVEDTDIRFIGEGRSLSVRSDYDRVENLHSWSFWPFGNCSARPFVEYTISMPRSARLEIRDHKSRITATGLASIVKIETHNGEVDLEDMAGRVSCETHNGRVRVAFAKMSGSSEFETHNGDVEITMPKDAGFTLSADVSRHGRLNSDFPLTTTMDRHRRDERLQGAVNGGGPSLRLSTHGGTFRLRSA